jgi:NDP-sugar pyrophosphorylase family protein
MCLRDGTILVAPVWIGARSMVGHSALIAPGVSIGDDVEVGVASAVSVGVLVGDRTRIGHCSDIDRKVVIGPDCSLNECARIGFASTIPEGTRTLFGLTVPPKSRLGRRHNPNELAQGQGIVRSARFDRGSNVGRIDSAIEQDRTGN